MAEMSETTNKFVNQYSVPVPIQMIPSRVGSGMVASDGVSDGSGKRVGYIYEYMQRGLAEL